MTCTGGKGISLFYGKFTHKPEILTSTIRPKWHWPILLCQKWWLKAVFVPECGKKEQNLKCSLDKFITVSIHFYLNCRCTKLLLGSDTLMNRRMQIKPNLRAKVLRISILLFLIKKNNFYSVITFLVWTKNEELCFRETENYYDSRRWWSSVSCRLNFREFVIVG